MSDLILISFIAIFGLINFIRGRGYIPYAEHVVAPIAWGVLTGFTAHFLNYSDNYSIALALITFVGMLIWMIGLVPGWGGWGLYFASWDWIWNPNESEVPPIDWVGMKLVPFVTMAPHWTNGLRGSICMGLRGLYILPLFFALGSFPLGVMIGLMQGVVYGSMHWLAPTAGTKYAEPAYAAIVGAAIAGILIGGF